MCINNTQVWRKVQAFTSIFVYNHRLNDDIADVKLQIPVEDGTFQYRSAMGPMTIDKGNLFALVLDTEPTANYCDSGSSIT